MRLEALLFLVRKLYNKNIVLISDDDIQQGQYLGIRGKDKKSEIIYGEVPKSPGSDQLTKVIIKALIPSSNDDAKFRFLKEILVHGNLRHKNLVSLVAFSVDGDRENFMVKYVNGGSLDDYLSEQENTLPLLELVGLMVDVAKGLRYLHGKRVLHNDLTADNCMVKICKSPKLFLKKRSQCTVKIGDFGNAKVVSESNGCRFLFEMDPRLPVPIGFAPPEALKRDHLTPASDCYTIGVLFWQILHYGAQPWGHLRDETEVKKAVVEDQELLPLPQVLRDKQPQLAALIDRCQSPKPTDRPKIEDIIAELRQILSQLRSKEQDVWLMPKLQARPDTDEDDAPIQTPTVFESLLQPADDEDEDFDGCPQTAFDEDLYEGSASGMLKKNNAGNGAGAEADYYAESSFGHGYDQGSPSPTRKNNAGNAAGAEADYYAESSFGHGYDQGSPSPTRKNNADIVYNRAEAYSQASLETSALGIPTKKSSDSIGSEYATIGSVPKGKDPEIAPFPASKQKNTRKRNETFNRLCATEIVADGCELGQGSFGLVRRATIQKEGGYKWMGIHFGSHRQTSQTVAVKTTHTGKDRDARLFLQEVLLLGHLHHKNIVEQIGICLDARPIMLVMELMDGGNLRNYLLKPNVQRNITPLEILNILIDVAHALCYLVDEGIVHGDLSAKNCLLQLEPFTVKLSDFGLAKDIRARQQYNTVKPIFAVAWTAPEGFRGIFCLKSDIWSFGVLLWEAFSWAAKPFRACSFRKSCQCKTGLKFPMGSGDIQRFICGRRKSLADLPSPCGAFFPEEIKSLMSVCCSFESKHRPTARQLLTFLKQCKKALARVPNQYDLIPNVPARRIPEVAAPYLSDYGYAISSLNGDDDQYGTIDTNGTATQYQYNYDNILPYEDIG